MLHLFSYEMSFDLDARKKDQEAIVRYVGIALEKGQKRLENNPKDSEAYLAEESPGGRSRKHVWAHPG
jgi:hypothetical protein